MMKKLFPIISAVGLVITWASTLLAVPSVLSLFADFKVEAPVLTLAFLWFYQLLGGWALPLVVVATAMLLGFQTRAGWILALLLYVLCDLGCIGLVMFVVSLVNVLSGAEATSTPSLILPTFVDPAIAPGTGALLALVAFLLNQALLVILLVKRRDFAR